MTEHEASVKGVIAEAFGMKVGRWYYKVKGTGKEYNIPRVMVECTRSSDTNVRTGFCRGFKSVVDKMEPVQA